MIRIRGGSGLGDSIYLRPIAEHLVARGHRVTALSFFPDLFIGSTAAVAPFSKSAATLIAHYSTARQNQATTQYQDMLDAARISEPVPLRFDWTVRNQALVDRLRTRAAGRRLVIVHGGRAPFGRTDGFGMKLVPGRAAFEIALNALSDCFTVRVGQAEQLYPLPVDVDLNGSTSVSDLLDLGLVCDGVVAQCSYAVPLAEVFDKPLLGVWSARGLACSYSDILRSITPSKILSKPTSRHVVDDWAADRIRDEVRQTFGMYMAVAA